MSNYFKDIESYKVGWLKVLFYKLFGKKLITWDCSGGGKITKMTAYWFRGKVLVTRFEHFK